MEQIVLSRLCSPCTPPPFLYPRCTLFTQPRSWPCIHAMTTPVQQPQLSLPHMDQSHIENLQPTLDHRRRRAIHPSPQTDHHHHHPQVPPYTRDRHDPLPGTRVITEPFVEHVTGMQALNPAGGLFSLSSLCVSRCSSCADIGLLRPKLNLGGSIFVRINVCCGCLQLQVC